jgi:hypothetical protein
MDLSMPYSAWLFYKESHIAAKGITNLKKIYPFEKFDY